MKLDVIRAAVGDAVLDPLEDRRFVLGRKMIPSQLAQNLSLPDSNDLICCTDQTAKPSHI
jgi:hypothetical protein